MDKEVLSILAYFQEHLEEMSSRFQKLKDITYQLYKENEELKSENEELKEIVFARKKERKERQFPISSIYIGKGYHVCHPSFAERRKGDCLFCQQLIDNQLTED